MMGFHPECFVGHTNANSALRQVLGFVSRSDHGALAAYLEHLLAVADTGDMRRVWRKAKTSFYVDGKGARELFRLTLEILQADAPRR